MATTSSTRQDQAAATWSPRGTARSNSGVVVVATATSESGLVSAGSFTTTGPT